MEVDFVVELPGGATLGIEVKAATSVDARDLRGLRALREDVPSLVPIVVCREPHARHTEDGIHIVPLERFLEGPWAGRWWVVRRAGEDTLHLRAPSC